MKATDLNFQDLETGDVIFTMVKKPISRIQLVRYAGASGDFNPIHVDPRNGCEQIAHGMLIMGFMGEAITNWVDRKFLRRFSSRFTGMTYIGDVLTITGVFIEKQRNGTQNMIQCRVTAVNQKAETVASASFEIAVPDT